MQKALTLLQDYLHTQVISGSKIEFFFFYWHTKGAAFLHRVFGTPSPNTIGTRPPFIIKNKIGTFVVPRVHDDTLTICSEYFESHLTHWLRKPAHKRTLLDIGANRGRYTILGLDTYNYAHAYAFEPFPQTVEILTKNISLNNIDAKVSTLPVALGAKEGSAELYVDAAHLGGAYIGNGDSQESSTLHTTVAVKTLDACITPEVAKTVDFIKIDTEGYEYDVLLGAKDTLTHLPSGAYLMIETIDQEKISDYLAPFGIITAERIRNDSLFVKE